MWRSAASLELTRQVEKSTPAAPSRFVPFLFLAALLILVPEPSRTRGLIFLSSLVSPLQPLGLGFLGRGDPRFFIFLCRYGRRSGQPSSSSLARRACVHYSSWLTVYLRRHWYSYPSSSSGHPEVHKRPWPLRGSRGDGNGGRFVRSVARFAPLRCTPDAVPLFPVQQQSIELPATTVGACRRHKGGLWTVRLIPVHYVLLQGGFFILCRRDPLA